MVFLFEESTSVSQGVALCVVFVLLIAVISKTTRIERLTIEKPYLHLKYLAGFLLVIGIVAGAGWLSLLILGLS